MREYLIYFIYSIYIYIIYAIASEICLVITCKYWVLSICQFLQNFSFRFANISCSFTFRPACHSLSFVYIQSLSHSFIRLLLVLLQYIFISFFFIRPHILWRIHALCRCQFDMPHCNFRKLRVNRFKFSLVYVWFCLHSQPQPQSQSRPHIIQQTFFPLYFWGWGA